MANNKDKKLDDLKKIFESSGIEITDDQLKLFDKTFSLMLEKKLDDKVKPLNEKVQKYQKHNNELQVQLEESKNFQPILNENSQKFDKLIEEKIKKLSELNIPKGEDISKLIEKKLSPIDKNIDDKIKKFDQDLKELKESIETIKNIKLSESINKMGKVFDKYQEDFVNSITSKESEEINSLKEHVNKLIEQNNNKDLEILKLNEQMMDEKESNEYKSLIESISDDVSEYEYLMGLYKPAKLEEAKHAVSQYVKMKELKKERENKETKERFMTNESRIKKTNANIIKERKYNEYDSDMDRYVKLARVDNS